MGNVLKQEVSFQNKSILILYNSQSAFFMVL